MGLVAGVLTAAKSKGSEKSEPLTVGLLAARKPRGIAHILIVGLIK